MSWLGVTIFVLLFALVLGAIAFSHHREKQRRLALASLAAELDFSFTAAKNRALAREFSFLNRLRTGSNRYVFNALSGVSDLGRVMIFDFHYETQSRDSKGRTQTSHHYLSFFTISLPKSFPELTISHEGLFSKVAQAFGYDDIDFESHEFSRRFCVRSRDKKFAYDVCHAQMIEFFLDNRDLQLEIDHAVLALIFENKLDPQRVRHEFERLLTIRRLLPEYLLADVGERS